MNEKTGLLWSNENNSLTSLSESSASDVLLDDDLVFSEYLQFISKYGKTSYDPQQFEYRLKVFRENYKRIVEHNKIPDSGFDMEVNQFADLTEAEFLKGYTGLMVPKEKTDKLRGTSIPTEEEIELQ